MNKLNFIFSFLVYFVMLSATVDGYPYSYDDYYIDLSDSQSSPNNETFENNYSNYDDIIQEAINKALKKSSSEPAPLAPESESTSEYWAIVTEYYPSIRPTIRDSGTYLKPPVPLILAFLSIAYLIFM